MEHTNIFIEGMNTDDHPSYISDREYTYALNALLETTSGEVGAISTEPSNRLAFSLPDKYTVVGSIPTNSNSFILFCVGDTGAGIIGEYTPNGKQQFIELIKTSDLGFTRSQPIQGIFRLRNGCERVIYFTDRINSFKVINLDKLSEYKDSIGRWDVTRFHLNRTFKLAALNTVSILNSGGSLRVGSYQFTYRYLDFDGNSTNWAPLSNSYNIFHDSTSSSFDTLQGDVDSEYYTSNEGGIKESSKAINIYFTNLDTAYKYVEVGVVKFLEGLGVATESAILSKVPITSSTTTVFYTGNIDNEIRTDLAALTTDKEAIETVGTLAQVNSNLYIANVSSKHYQWADFQRAASKITTTLKVEKIPAYSAVTKGNPKSGADALSYVDDEVYAMGIVYIMKDGTYSPTFHIPGRASTTGERELITSWTADVSPWAATSADYLRDYAVVEFETATKLSVRKFHVFNTGSATKMAYYESDQLYTKIGDCTNKSVWGMDSNNVFLEDTPIRYHKFPDRKTIPLVEKVNTTWYINKLGFDFGNIVYPSSDVQSHIIVQAKQNENNRTVLDQGMLNTTKRVTGKLFSEGSQEYYTYLPENGTGSNRQGGFNADVLAFTSAKTVYEQSISNHDYVKINSFYGQPPQRNKTERYSTPGFLAGKIEALVSNYQRNNSAFEPFANSRTNLRVLDSAVVSPTSFQPLFGNFTAGLYNSLASHTMCFLQIDSNQMSNIAIKNAADGMLKTVYASLKSTRKVYNNIYDLEYIPAQGDWLPVPFDMFQILLTDPSSFLSGGDADATYISHTWMMSPFNYGLKYSGTTDTKKVFRGNTSLGPDYLISKVATKQQNDKYEVKKLEEVSPEFVGINRDYSKKNDERVFYPLDLTYDYCNDCENMFPNRIYYSKKDNLESLVDNYRIFLANNYRNLDGYGEEIVQLLVDKDELYALCKNYTYYIPTRNQEIKTDSSVAYIGTGSELSTPPKRLSSTSYSYGGCDQPLSVISTEFGSFWVDSFSGKVFQLSSSLAEISSIKMSAFFEKELPSVLNTRYKVVTGIDYNNNWQFVGKASLGVFITYDPRYKRIILTKKDYIPLYGLKLQGSSKDKNSIYVKDSKFYTWDNTEIQLTSTSYFKDNSFTVSFSLKHNKWISFHSYVPSYYFNDSNVFYSVKDNGLYVHMSDTYHTYYGTTFPFELEAVSNKPFNTEKTFNSFTIGGKNLHSNKIQGLISHIWAYNEDYSSGKLKLKTYNTFVTLLAGEIFQRLVVDKLNITGIRDLSLTDQSQYQTNYSVDRIPTNVNINKSNWEQNLIKGRHLFTKLYKTASPESKLSIDSLQVNFNISTR